MIRRPLRCDSAIQFGIGMYYYHSGNWTIGAKPEGCKTWLSIRAAPKPHSRTLCTTNDYVSYIPKHIYHYFLTHPAGIKYLDRMYNAPCSHNNQTCSMMRLFSNWKTGAKFLEPFPKPTYKHYSKLVKVRDVVIEILRAHQIKPWTLKETALKSDKVNVPSDEFVAEFGVGVYKRDPKRYFRCFEKFCTTENNNQEIQGTWFPRRRTLKRLSRVNPFGKSELLAQDKPVRGISPRKPDFNLVWAQFVGPLEEVLFTVLGPYGPMKRFVDSRKTLKYNRWIGKGLNAIERGILTEMKLNSLRAHYGVDFIVIPTDCSGFDSHVRRKMMELALSIFPILFGEWKEHLRFLLSNIYRTELNGEGFDAMWEDALMSGDRHTSLVACLIMVYLYVGFFSHYRIRRFDLFVDGDDTLIFIHPDDLKHVKSALPAWFLDFGFELKVEKVCRTIEEIEWCQCSPIPVYVEGYGNTFTYVRNPYRVLASIGTHIHARDSATSQDFFDSMRIAYAVAYDFIPMFKSLSPSRKPKPVPVLNPGLMQDLHARLKYRVLSNEHTASVFCHTFDWPVNMYFAPIPPLQVEDNPQSGVVLHPRHSLCCPGADRHT